MIKKRLRRWTMLEFLEAFAYAAVIGLVIRLFVLTPFKVNDNDMFPTIQAGDFVLSYDLAYGLQNIFGTGKVGAKLPKIGDPVIVKINSDGDFAEAKRVWGRPGDRVEVIKNQVWINSVLTSISAGKVNSYGPIIVPPNYIFVSGDNAITINAAEGNGLVKISALQGLIWRIWFSMSWESKEQSYWSAIRWRRIFSSVD